MGVLVCVFDETKTKTSQKRQSGLEKVCLPGFEEKVFPEQKDLQVRYKLACIEALWVAREEKILRLWLSDEHPQVAAATRAALRSLD